MDLKEIEADIFGVVNLLSSIPQMKEDIIQLKSEVSFWKELAFAKQWLDRKQTKEILGMCDVTLQKIANDRTEYERDLIRRRYTGKKPFYYIEDIRKYLGIKKNITSDEASKRILLKM